MILLTGLRVAAVVLCGVFLGRRERILYFEGAARFEAKFLRRAVQDDKNLQVVTLERTSENKFLRLDVHQFVKKTDRTPPREMAVARHRMKEIKDV